MLLGDPAGADLELARACHDDRDLDCTRTAAGRAFANQPDDPSPQVLLAAVAAEKDEDLEELRSALLPLGLAATSSPSRKELLLLTWRYIEVSRRIDQELPGPDLLAERARVLADLSAFEPGDALEEERRDILLLTLLRDEDPTPGQGASLPFIDEQLARGDPPALMAIARSLEAGGAEDRRAVLIDKLLRSDPASPRYDLYLVYAAQHDPHPVEALERLIRGGLDRRYQDDAEILLAGHLIEERGTLPPSQWRGLHRLVFEDRLHNTTVVAAQLLAGIDFNRGRLLEAQQAIRRVEGLDPHARKALGPIEARLRASHRDWSGAEQALLGSLRSGGSDFERWWDLAEYYRKDHRLEEAARLYRFYLVQVDERASGALPLGPVVDPAREVAAHAKVWSRYALLEPDFFAHSAVRQLSELLALTSAALLALARISRARRFLFPGLLAAEVVLLAGWVTLRCLPRGAGSTVALEWLWVASSSGRALVLVAGGLFLSASLSLPRHTRLSRPLLGLSALLAALAGIWCGFAHRPGFLPDDLSPVARLGELGLGPDSLREAPLLLIAVIRSEASSRLVWPALVLSTLASGRSYRAASAATRWSAILAAAAITSTGTIASGGASGYVGAFCCAIVLTFARLRFGSLLPFVMHAAFSTGALLALSTQ